jgi:hypothetical protein
VSGHGQALTGLLEGLQHLPEAAAPQLDLRLQRPQLIRLQLIKGGDLRQVEAAHVATSIPFGRGSGGRGSPLRI